MNELRQWALCLIISAAAVTLVSVISPRGSTEKTVRAVTGIFVVSAIFTPLTDITFDYTAVSAVQEYDDSSDELNRYILETCRAAAEQAVLEAADGAGTAVESISVNADVNTDGCIIIHDITVTVAAENADISGELSQIFGSALGVPVEVNAE